MKIKDIIPYIHKDTLIQLEYTDIYIGDGIKNRTRKWIKLVPDATPLPETIVPFKNLEEIYNIPIEEQEISVTINPYDFKQGILKINSSYIKEHS